MYFKTLEANYTFYIVKSLNYFIIKAIGIVLILVDLNEFSSIF